MRVSSCQITPTRPIDPDTWVCLTELARLIPPRGIQQRPVSKKTLCSYCLDGVDGIILESRKVGKYRYTTWNSYGRFLDALERRQRDLERERLRRLQEAKLGPGKRRSHEARQRAARRRLEQAGAI